MFRGDQPGSLASALDPNEIISARDVHLHDSSLLRPEPAKSAPKSSRADAHTPARLAPQLVFVDVLRFRNFIPAQLPPPQRPDYLENAGLHHESGWSEPEPYPSVDANEQQCRERQPTPVDSRQRQKYGRQGQQDERKHEYQWRHRCESKAGGRGTQCGTNHKPEIAAW